MSALQKQVLKVGLVLGLFAIVSTTLVAFTEQQTRSQIIENQRQALLDAINTLVSHDVYDNPILKDTLTLPALDMLGTTEDTLVYRARMGDKPAAAIFSVTAPDGYTGRINMLVGVNFDGSLAGVRVISHQETPGLGDKIDEKRSDWILQFAGLSLQNPTLGKWKVKKDGGHFDQFTGATITPRAVVRAVKKALQYYDENRDNLFVVIEESQ